MLRRLLHALGIVTVAAIGLAMIALAALLGLRFWVDQTYKDRIYFDIERVPERPIAIVFGAGVDPAGRLSSILADRVDTALELYRAGKVQKLFLTGDNRFVWYNEPGSMASYLLDRGVPRSDLVLDYAGRRTYDSCYRAMHIFGIDQAILVTQNYHLDRALFTCNGLGMDAIGVAANRVPSSRFYWLRELPAVLVAWWDIHVRHPLPVMGDPLPIDWSE